MVAFREIELLSGGENQVIEHGSFYPILSGVPFASGAKILKESIMDCDTRHVIEESPSSRTGYRQRRSLFASLKR
jgi:hypothetical protein